jgi:hypothetical protein
VGTLRGAVEIKKPTTAAGRRDIHAPVEVLEALRTHKARQNEHRLSLGEAWRDHDLIFPSAIGTPIQPDNLAIDFNRLTARAGVPRIRIHDVRRSYATLAIDLGAPIKAVSEALGHADVATTPRTYTHVLPSQRVEVANKVGAALFRQGSSTAVGNLLRDRVIDVGAVASRGHVSGCPPFAAPLRAQRSAPVSARSRRYCRRAASRAWMVFGACSV